MKTLSDAIGKFLRDNASSHIYADCWRPAHASDSDAWEVRIDGGTMDERDELMRLVEAFRLGWQMRRMVEAEELRNSVVLRDIIKPV